MGAPEGHKIIADDGEDGGGDGEEYDDDGDGDDGDGCSDKAGNRLPIRNLCPLTGGDHDFMRRRQMTRN